MSLDEGLETISEVVALLEANGVEVDDAREVATTLDGELVQATITVRAPVGADANGDGGATDGE